MDRQLAERMVGAACLLAVLVLVVPAILDGNPDSGATMTHPPAEESLDLRTHTIRLDSAEREPPVPEPRQVAAVPEAPPVLPATETGSALRPGSSTGGSTAPAAGDTESPAPERATAKPAVREPPEPARAPANAESPAPKERGAAGEAPSGGLAPPSGDWMVQLGSFSQRANADRLAADLKRKGFSASVKGGGGSSGTLFRVRAGPATDRAAAEALAGRLAAAGFKGGRVGRD